MAELVVIFGNTIAGAINGVAIAGLGYLKTKKETFSMSKFGETVIIGAIVGAGSGVTGLNYADSDAWFQSSGLIVVVDWALKAIVRKFKKVIE